MAKAPPKPTVNPLTAKWNGGLAMPPFDKIEVRHFKPALEFGISRTQHRNRKDREESAKPTFANTILALEKSGWQLSRIASVFWNLEASDIAPGVTGSGA